MDLSKATVHPDNDEEYDLPNDDEMALLSKLLSAYGICGVLEAVTVICSEDPELTDIQIAWCYV